MLKKYLYPIKNAHTLHAVMKYLFPPNVYFTYPKLGYF